MIEASRPRDSPVLVLSESNPFPLFLAMLSKFILVSVIINQVVFGTIDYSAVAYGSYDAATNHISNFAVLKIETNSSFSDDEQYFAAGYLEGAFTNAGIFDLYNNFLSTFSWAKTGPPACLTSWVTAQDAYVRAQIANPTGDLLFWQQLGLIMNQVSELSVCALCPRVLL
jgi:hypothetical protein